MLKETVGMSSAKSGQWDKPTNFVNKYPHKEQIK